MRYFRKLLCLFLCLFCLNLGINAMWSITLQPAQIDVQHEIGLARTRRIQHPSVYSGMFNTFYGKEKSATHWAIRAIQLAKQLNRSLYIAEHNGIFIYRTSAMEMPM